MKIHAAVRLDNEVYLPDNDEHAALLADRLNDRQKIRLSDSGAISGPGSEVAGHEVIRNKSGELDDTGGVITKAPSKKDQAKEKAAKKKADAAAKKKADAEAAEEVKAAETEAAEAAAAAENPKAEKAEGEAAENPEEGKSTEGEGSSGEGWPDGQAPE